MEGDITAVLEDWRVQPLYEDAYMIVGNIHGDAKGRWEDGTTIHTSVVWDGRHDRLSLSEGDVVNTTYSKYKLGKQRKARK